MTAQAFDAVRANLAAALKDAMRARDAAATTALRALLHRVDNATAVDVTTTRAADPLHSGPSEVARRVPSADELAAIVAAEHAERAGAAREYEALGQHERAARLRAEAEVVARYL